MMPVKIRIKVFITIIHFLLGAYLTSGCSTARLYLDTPLFEIHIDEDCIIDMQFYKDFYMLDSMARQYSLHEDSSEVKYFFRFKFTQGGSKMASELIYWQYKNDSVKHSHPAVNHLVSKLRIDWKIIYCKHEKIQYSVPINFKIQ